MKKILSFLFVTFVVFASAVSAYAAGPLLMQTPTLSKTHIAFAYAGDLWLAAREGGEARLLTSGSGTKSNPVFSPDGSMIAFTGDYDGNVDIYVMPSSAGVPKRLTYHPDADRLVGWTPDGKSRCYPIKFSWRTAKIRQFRRLLWGIMCPSGGL